jgi:hypothetical protein
VVRDPERQGGVQVLTAHQEDLLEVAEARTEVRVVGADPRQAGLPVAVAVAIGRSRSRRVVGAAGVRGHWPDLLLSEALGISCPSLRGFLATQHQTGRRVRLSEKKQVLD